MLIFFVAIFIFAFALGKILLKFATNLGVRTHGEEIVRWTKTTKPSLGGIIFFLTFLLSIVFYLIAYVENREFNNLTFLGLVVTVVMGFMMGIADDAYNTTPWLKFLIQLLCAFISIICGNFIQLTGNTFINYSLTVLWIVGLMNSLNMLDNMDGITASVTSIASIFLLVIPLLFVQLFDYNFILIIGVLGGLLAFLFYNWNPSKMYMGDAGSQFVGIFFSYVSIQHVWNIPIEVNTSSSIFRILFAISFFIITISDTTTVFINRIRKGKSPFIGGRDHTTHHLVYAGFTQMKVAILYIIISVFSCLIGLFILEMKLYNLWYVNLAFAAVLFFIFLSLFYVTQKYKNESKTN